MTSDVVKMVETGSALEDVDRWLAVAASVPDPEIPVLTLADLGILRDVQLLATSGVPGASVSGISMMRRSRMARDDGERSGSNGIG